MTPGRLGLLLTSPRVAPGLLSHAAWEAVAGSGLRLARSLQDPLAEAVEESGFAVEEVGDASPAELARRLVDIARSLPVVWLGSADGDPGLADAVAALVARPDALLPPPPAVPATAAHVVSSRPSPEITALGWQPRVGLAEGLRETITWERARIMSPQECLA